MLSDSRLPRSRWSPRNGKKLLKTLVLNHCLYLHFIVHPPLNHYLSSNVGKALKTQGSFILSAKKYTQAGDKIRAMKCLILSGDTKAVIQFANISRTADIYKLAANYLQQLNWRESVDIMKAIIMFYTKAKAYEQLAGFYDHCAQVHLLRSLLLALFKASPFPLLYYISPLSYIPSFPTPLCAFIGGDRRIS